MLEEELLNRMPNEPTVKQVRVALKFGKEFSHLEKAQAETEDYAQAMDYFTELVDATCEFLKVILKLKPKEVTELEDWSYQRMQNLAFKLFRKLINPTEEAEESGTEKK
ncbi:phage tail tube assembly chaperone [Melissococcus plutonius]|uniref:phage tail tube assembly chaperone n=1 Tax=Melissococcus plutonius TaxID=33970 RepID=UPI0021E57E55|nr:phage tail tube assembly chaperone [Melissococcus plutonius]MCV2498210.1 hypothetical protein [Melissococcus plutonius]MCV2501973.1 hypothetical protein [Melissococcus plutonius]MCV2506825.1 hypothetical protein [Melissococcus plutonius]MCV2528133.1 hypothetical protein [Melissococcus plutonius]